PADSAGAGDAGARFAGRGRGGVFVAPAEVDPRRVVIAVDTESRAVSMAEARRRVAAAAGRLGERLRRGVLFKKIDSTLRGPVGDEVDALQDASGRPVALVCPAFPAEGRTVVGGLLRVHGAAAHTSTVGGDPAYPAGLSDVAAILRRGTARPVRHLPLDRVRGGGDPIEGAALAAGIVAADAETDADLDALARAAASPDVLLAGSAGLARAVAARLGHAAPPAPLPAGCAWLIVAG